MDYLPNNSLLAQSTVSAALFIPGVFAFFFLIGLHRVLAVKSRARFLPIVIWLSYGYATLHSFVHLLGSGFLPGVTHLLLVPLAAIVAYRAGRRWANWFDSGHAWTLYAVLIASFVGGWAVQAAWFDSGPMVPMDTYLEPGVTVDTRAGRFVFDRRSLWGQELQGPLLDSMYDVTIFVAVFGACSLVCLCLRVRNRARGLQVALLLHPLLSQRWVPEASICMAACLLLAYSTTDKLPRESGRLGTWAKIAIAIGLFVSVVTVSNVLVWKFIGLATAPRWEIVCIGYGAVGLAIGRAIALLGPTPASPQRPHPSIDAALVQLRRLRATASGPAFRIDTVVALLPYLFLGVVAVLTTSVREVRISLEVLAVVLGLVGTITALLLVAHFRIRALTRQCVSVSSDRAAIMRLFSAAAHRSARLSAYEFTFMVLVPIIVPCAVCLYAGMQSVGGIVTAVITTVVAVVASRRAIASVRAMPPAVLVLGTSSVPAARLHALVSQSVAPLRAVSLLGIDRPDSSHVLPPRADCLRTIWHDDWLGVVRGLIDLAPWVVIDGRQSSEATRKELRLLEDCGRMQTCVLVCGEDGTAPLLDPGDHGQRTPAAAHNFLAVIPESGIDDVLRAAIDERRVAGAPRVVPIEHPFGGENAQQDTPGGATRFGDARAFRAPVVERAWEVARIGFSCIGVILVVAVPVLLVVGLLTGFVPLPKAWGPAPLSAAVEQARESVERLDLEQTPDPADRVAAVRTIFEIQDVPSIARAQELALTDPDESVRVEELNGLKRYLQENPAALVKKTWLGWRLGNHVRLDLIRALSVDPSPKVRIAVAEFWRDVSEFADERDERLSEMLTNETDPAVRLIIETAGKSPPPP